MRAIPTRHMFCVSRQMRTAGAALYRSCCLTFILILFTYLPIRDSGFAIRPTTAATSARVMVFSGLK